MQSNLIKIQDGTIYRILQERDSEWLVIDCIKRTMPKWIESLAEFESVPESVLWVTTGIYPTDTNTLSTKEKKYMNEHYSLFASVLGVIDDEKTRSYIIREIAELYKVTKQTIRNNLCLYLVYQDITVLLPHKKEKRNLTNDEKNMRWALNKYYYTTKKHSISDVYTMMLKEKYCDETGHLKEDHPSIHQFRYYFQKTKKLQNLYISRGGLKDYQKNHRPLLGDGVQEFAPNVGFGMLDSTICDIYLVNDAGEVVGRPILTACVDGYSGMCLGYSLGWKGGIYSVKGLMLNIVADKKEHCKKFGIDIADNVWDCHQMPGVMITDKGSEYISENFEQITELGIRLIDLPSYRPELKGSVEKFFDLIQNSFKTVLKGKGVIEPDFQERGAHDYRKDACITLEIFEKVLLHCIIYYNSGRILENYPFTEEMLSANIKPFACEVWNYGRNRNNANLIDVSAEQVIMTLLPRCIGKFARNGLKVNGLRYKHPNYTEMYLKGGEVTVAYNPDSVSDVWLIDNGEYVKFELIESRYEHMNVANVASINDVKKEVIKQAENENKQAKINLLKTIEVITAGSVPKSVPIKKIRENRTKEETRTHIDFTKGVKKYATRK